MSQPSSIPDNLKVGVRNALKKKRKIAIKCLIKQERDKGKWDDKVIALGSYRLYLLSTRDPSNIKIENSIHYLEIQSIDSKKSNQLVLRTSRGNTSLSYSFQSCEVSSDDIDHIILYITSALKTVFPKTDIQKLISVIDVQPTERLNLVNIRLRDIESKRLGPCGGFSQMYSCMCSYHDTEFREEVPWDIDMIYYSQENKELRLSDFDHMYPSDLVPIISALEYNSWFTKLNAQTKEKLFKGHYKISDVFSRILKVIHKNIFLEELNLSRTGIKCDFAKLLSTTMTSNTSINLTTLDLSCNALEDRGVISLSGPLGKLPQGLKYLNLESVGFTGRGLMKLIEGLWENKMIHSTLTYLNLSNNTLMRGTDESSLLVFLKFLSMPNALEVLNLSNTELALESVIGALQIGCVHNLVELDISKNPFYSRKSKEPPLAWKSFFTSTLRLKRVKLSDCRLPPEALRELLLGIGSNKFVQEYDLDISGNALKSEGSSVIESCIAGVPITRLDISNNGFDADLQRMLEWIQQNHYIKHLAMGQNMHGILPRSSRFTQAEKESPLQHVLNKIVDLIVDESSSLESLSLADSKLKADTTIILSGLGSNHKLHQLDISGNQMEDFGARMLAKALQLNTKLKTILWDKNGTSAAGFEDMAFALETNYTVLDMPTPVHDAAAALRSLPDRTESALQKIEECLQRNHRPNKNTAEVEFKVEGHKLGQGIIKELYENTEILRDTVVRLNAVGGNDELTTEATKLAEDAENWELLLPTMHKAVSDSQAALEAHFKEVTQKMNDTIVEKLQETSAQIIECAVKECPGVMDEEFKKKLTAMSEENSSAKFTSQEVIMQKFIGKFSELSLNLSLEVSKQVVDQILTKMAAKSDSLAKCLSDKLQKKEETSKMDATDGAKAKPENNQVITLIEPVKRTPSSDSISPAQRRKYVDIGKNRTSVRPKSVVPAKIIQITEMPDGQSAKKLTHLTKNRPVRPKTTRPTRAVLQDVGRNPMNEDDDDRPPRPTNTPSPRHNSNTNKTSHKPGKDDNSDKNHKEPPDIGAEKADKAKGISGMMQKGKNFFGLRKKSSTTDIKDKKDKESKKSITPEKSPQTKKKETPQRLPMTQDKPTEARKSSLKGNDITDSKAEVKKSKPAVPRERPSSFKATEEKKEPDIKEETENKEEEKVETRTESVPPRRPIGVSMGPMMSSALLQQMKAKQANTRKTVSGTKTDSNKEPTPVKSEEVPKAPSRTKRASSQVDETTVPEEKPKTHEETKIQAPSRTKRKSLEEMDEKPKIQETKNEPVTIKMDETKTDNLSASAKVDSVSTTDRSSSIKTDAKKSEQLHSNKTETKSERPPSAGKNDAIKPEDVAPAKAEDSKEHEKQTSPTVEKDAEESSLASTLKPLLSSDNKDRTTPPAAGESESPDQVDEEVTTKSRNGSFKETAVTAPTEAVMVEKVATLQLENTQVNAAVASKPVEKIMKAPEKPAPPTARPRPKPGPKPMKPPRPASSAVRPEPAKKSGPISPTIEKMSGIFEQQKTSDSNSADVKTAPQQSENQLDNSENKPAKQSQNMQDNVKVSSKRDSSNTEDKAIDDAPEKQIKSNDITDPVERNKSNQTDSVKQNGDGPNTRDSTDIDDEFDFVDEVTV